MKSIYELSEELRIPLRKLQKLHSLGHLAKVSFPERDTATKVIAQMKKGNPLTVEQIRALILNRNGELAAIPKEWAKPIGRMIVQLGDMSNSLQPDDFPHNLIFDAANKDADGLARFSAWIASIIPEGGCSYQYVGVRAALNISDVQFPVVYPVLAKAIRNARKHENLAGMSSIINRATVFHREKSFDL